MKILLVKSTGPSMTSQVLPPLGLLYLAGYLANFADRYDVRLLDMNVSPLPEYHSLLQSWSPDVVGISAMTTEARQAHNLASGAKKIKPHCKVIVGGPHPTAYPEEVMQDPNVDFAVLNEGELTLVDLLRELEAAGDFSEVSGIGYRDSQDQVHFTKPRSFNDDLDDLRPAWDILDFSLYAKWHSMSAIGYNRRTAPIFTSRACPYQCTYCHAIFGKKFRKRSVTNVLDELEMLVRKHGVELFEFVDDIFNLDRVRTRGILQGIIDRKLNVWLAFPNGLRGDLLDDELVDLFARAGTKFVSLAVETASPRLQKRIKKHLHFDKIEAAIRGFVDRRVFTNCFYMLGFPTETIQELRQTVDFACRQPSHSAYFFVVIPFQGTEIGDEAAVEHTVEHKDFDRYTYFGTNLSLSGEIPTPLLYRTARFAYLRFIANASRIYRYVRDWPHRGFPLRNLLLLFKRMLYDNLNDSAETVGTTDYRELAAQSSGC